MLDTLSVAQDLLKLLVEDYPLVTGGGGLVLLLLVLSFTVPLLKNLSTHAGNCVFRPKWNTNFGRSGTSISE